MRIVEVCDRTTWRLFFDVPKRIYANDPVYIPHLEEDIRGIFSPINKKRLDGGYKIWVSVDESGVTGRIAAFYQQSKDKAGIGFFECIDNQETANKLFDSAFQFLAESQKTEVEAPVNFGERDKYWGLLVRGFHHPGYQENYNPAYYQRLFESYGFVQEIVQTTQEISRETFNLKRFKPLADRIMNQPGYEFRTMKKGDWQGLISDFVKVYNLAWSGHEHFQPLDFNMVKNMLKPMKPIIREDLVIFAYHQHQPIGFYISLIDVNQIFKKLNGRLNWWGKMKFLYFLKTMKVDRIRGIVFGVIPAYHGRGVEAGMVMKMFEIFENEKKIKKSELAWVGDFNPKMLQLLRSLGAIETKVHITFQKKIKMSLQE